MAKKISIESTLQGCRDLDELKTALTRILSKLQTDLHNEPDFLVVTSEEQEVPTNTPVNTIIFKFDETAIVKTGYYDGENIILPP